jgi:lipopolysaccharide transport system ATP-binding protein
VNVGIFENQWSHAYDYHWHVYSLTVDGKPGHKGVLAPPCRWEALPATPSAEPAAADIAAS